MNEIEFAQVIAKNLQRETRETVLRSMRLKGFSIDGFRNLEKVPIGVLVNTLRKTTKKGEQCSSLFLKEVKECNLKDPVIEIVNLWSGTNEERKIAESNLMDLKMAASSNEMEVETQDGRKKFEQGQVQLENSLYDAKLNEQKNKNKQLQNRIQGLKIEIENVKKENQKQVQIIKNLQQELLETKAELQKVNGIGNEYKEKADFYEHILKRAPKILCFSKAKINKEDILLYNMTVCKNIELAKQLDWKSYNKIWISENDFSLEQIQEIKEKATQKVNTARNIKSIIERLR